MITTNIKPESLNYNTCTLEEYESQITKSIPYHNDIHILIRKFLKQSFSRYKKFQILELRIGTGITSLNILKELPNSRIDAVDFSDHMLSLARKKLGRKIASYILCDYSKLKFKKKYDLIISVIGIHHQSAKGKQMLFNKIAKHLKKGGAFIFSDLMTHKNSKIAALNHAYHYAFMVKNMKDEKILKEWVYHHIYLNDLSSVEDQIQWINEAGFSVNCLLKRFNTVLLACIKE